MENDFVLRLSIGDMTVLLQKAIHDHVLKGGEYDVIEVVWDGQTRSFAVSLRPKVRE